MNRSWAGWRTRSDGAANGADCVDAANWRKSSYSAANGGQCVEIATWRTSSYSAANGGNCVEVADRAARRVAVRDSTDPAGPKLTFATSVWQSFTDRVKNGQHTR